MYQLGGSHQIYGTANIGLGHQNTRRSLNTFGSSLPQYIKQDCRNGPTSVPTSVNNSFSASSTPASIPTSSTSTSMSFRYYQPPKKSRVESDSEDESSEEEYSRNRRSGSSGQQQYAKRGACTHCKGLKVKCHFAIGQTSCQRCNLNKLQCLVNGRKKRRAVATHEELVIKSRKQDVEIATLLRQLDELQTEHRIQGFIAKTKHTAYGQSPEGSHNSKMSSKSSDIGMDGPWGSAYSVEQYSSSPGTHSLDIYGNPVPFPSSDMPRGAQYSTAQLLRYFPTDSGNRSPVGPDILTRAVIHPEDVLSLFDLYFRHINPFFSILDEYLHTPERLVWDSHFLFTAICTLAAKHHSHYCAMMPSLLEFVRDAAGKALVQGKKTVDECQAFLLIAVYQAPKKQWESQRGWLHMGIAFTLAQELRLNEPFCVNDPATANDGRRMSHEMVARTRLNRMRTWLNCYCVDASHATQFGKPAMIEVDDFAARTCREWYRSSPFNLPIDVHLVAYVEVLNTMRHFKIEVDALEIEEKAHPKKPRKTKELLELVDKYHRGLLTLLREWTERFKAHPQRNEWMCQYREDTHRMNNAYCRLVILFRGLQKAVAAKKGEEGGGVTRDNELVRQCIQTAKEIIIGMTQKLYPTGMLHYSMPAHFLFVSFAAAHLLSLLRPKMSILLRPGDIEEIDRHVRELVQVLQNVAGTDERHSAILYARYLTRQLRKFSPFSPPPSSTIPFGSQSAKGNGIVGQQLTGDPISPTWAPIENALYANIPTTLGSGDPSMHDVQNTVALDGHAYQLSDFELDFSLQYFMQTVNEPQFSKATPPPGEAPPLWWQPMYPVANQQAPDACEWPLAIGGHAGIPEVNAHRQRFSPELLR